MQIGEGKIKVLYHKKSACIYYSMPWPSLYRSGGKCVLTSAPGSIRCKPVHVHLVYEYRNVKLKCNKRCHIPSLPYARDFSQTVLLFPLSFLEELKVVKHFEGLLSSGV